MVDSTPAALSAAGPVLAAAVSGRVRPNVKLIGLLVAGHCIIDVNQRSLTAALWRAVLLPGAGFAAGRFLPAPRTASVR